MNPRNPGHAAPARGAAIRRAPLILAALAAAVLAAAASLASCLYPLPTFDNPLDRKGITYVGNRDSASGSSGYFVYGGDTDIFALDGWTGGYRPEDHGFTLLGRASTSAWFVGEYAYYALVVTEGSYELDAVLNQDNAPIGGWTGNASTGSNDWHAVDGASMRLAPVAYNRSACGGAAPVGTTGVKVILLGDRAEDYGPTSETPVRLYIRETNPISTAVSDGFNWAPGTASFDYMGFTSRHNGVSMVFNPATPDAAWSVPGGGTLSSMIWFLGSLGVDGASGSIASSLTHPSTDWGGNGDIYRSYSYAMASEVDLGLSLPSPVLGGTIDKAMAETLYRVDFSVTSTAALAQGSGTLVVSHSGSGPGGVIYLRYDHSNGYTSLVYQSAASGSSVAFFKQDLIEYAWTMVPTASLPDLTGATWITATWEIAATPFPPP